LRSIVVSLMTVMLDGHDPTGIYFQAALDRDQI
jgi:hypothetical protein